MFLLQLPSVKLIKIFKILIIKIKNMRTTQASRIRNLPLIRAPNRTAASNMSLGNLAAESTSINITNRQYAERKGKYTNGLKENLDPRDRQFIIPFEASFSLANFLAQATPVIRSQQYAKMKLKIYNYVAQLCENINSISFQLFNEGKLIQNQVKAFASKNILANIQSVLTDIKEKFSHFNITHRQENQELLQQLTYSIDEELREVLSQLANNYPQAPPTGVTPRMKRVITDINRSQDEKNDFIVTNGFKIHQYIPNSYNQTSQLYTGFIMEVIDRVITIAGETLQDQDETVMQKFQHFNQTLFSISSNKSVGELFENDKSNNNQLITKVFSNQFKNTAQKSQGQYKDIQNIIQETIQNFKKDNKQKYKIGRKIPSHIQHFSAANLRQSDFYVNSSSVLRIMTKWAQNLQEIFEHPDFRIMQRVQEFKNIQNQFKKLGQDEKKQIVQKLKISYEQIKKEFQIMKEKNNLFKSYFLSTNQPPTAYLKRFTEVRTASSQINATLIEFTRKYLCLLIHHLILAGKIIKRQKGKWGTSSENIHIDLVVFRVGDLLRSKIQSSESEFINIMSNLLLLDQSKEMEGKFKLVRIKNKLNQRDSNVLINYLFMGKVQCELQLSVQNMAPKDKNYYSFCHFLYELTRGKFGVLTECATIVCQHDPIISSSSDAYYRPKHYETVQDGKQLTHSIHKKNPTIFLCWKCHQLITNENIILFAQKQTACNQCICKQQQAEQKLRMLSQAHLKMFLLNSLKDQKVKRIRNYSQVQSGNYILSLSNRQKKEIGTIIIVWEHKKQFKLFFIKINNAISSGYNQETDWSKVDYFDISCLKTEKKDFTDLTFMVSKEILMQTFRQLRLSVSFSMQTLRQFQLGFKKFREEKLLVKQIKSRCDIIQIQNDKEKLQALNKITQSFGENKGQIFPYKQQSTLDYSHIKKLSFKQMQLVLAPVFLNYMDGVKQIMISGNKISNISLSRITTLQLLDIYGCQVEQVSTQGCKILKQLSIKKTQLIKMDLTKNTLLQNLCITNSALIDIQIGQKLFLKNILIQNSQLAQINLTQSPLLEKLTIKCGKLKSIDLCKNININLLHLDDNLIEAIELGENAKITQLNLSKNRLTAIDLNKLTEIVEVCIDQNFISEIDFSKNIKLIELSLRKNNISAINLSNNILMNNLKLSSNQLSIIDISKNTKIERLNLSQNKLTMIDLSKNNIEYLQLNENDFTEIDLNDIKHLKLLFMSGNKLSSIDLKRHKNLNILDLENNILTQITLNSNNLHGLSLAGNSFSSISTWLSPRFSEESFCNQRSESCQVTLMYSQRDSKKRNYPQIAKSLIQKYENSQTCKYTFKIQVKQDNKY